MKKILLLLLLVVLLNGCATPRRTDIIGEEHLSDMIQGTLIKDVKSTYYLGTNYVNVFIRFRDEEDVDEAISLMYSFFTSNEYTDSYKAAGIEFFNPTTYRIQISRNRFFKPKMIDENDILESVELSFSDCTAGGNPIEVKDTLCRSYIKEIDGKSN